MIYIYQDNEGFKLKHLDLLNDIFLCLLLLYLLNGFYLLFPNLSSVEKGKCTHV